LSKLKAHDMPLPAACWTVTVLPATVIVPVCDDVDVFCVTEYCTVPEPVRVPELPEETVIHAELDTADQVQLEVEEPTLIEPVCAWLLRETDPGVTVKVQADVPPADWVTVNA
jgi:hypothetical protein